MIGTWQGPVETPLLGSLSLVMTFKPKFAYVMCNASGQCSEPGLYFVTDLLTNGHFAGELQNRSMERTAWLDDIWIDDVDGSEVLHFTLYDELSLLNAALTRASD